MPEIVRPTEEQLEKLCKPHLEHEEPIAIAIGCASPAFPGAGFLHFHAGRVVNQNRQMLKLTGNTLFELGSVTKTFTATLFELLVQFGRIAPGATLRDFYPQGSRSVGRQFMDIPLLTLGNFTSGLPEDNEQRTDVPDPLPTPYTVEDLFLYLALTDLELAPPGQAYAYSDLGFSLLAETLPVALGGLHTFSRHLAMEVLAPLGMDNTRMFGEIPLDLLPLGFDVNGKKITPGQPGNNVFPAYNGGGGLVSTPNNMMSWLQFNMGIASNPYPFDLLPVLQNPSTGVTGPGGDQIGVGWFLGEVEKSPVVWKGGGLSGGTSFVTFLRSPNPGKIPSRAGVFVLTNLNNKKFSPAAAIAKDVLALMMGA